MLFGIIKQLLTGMRVIASLLFPGKPNAIVGVERNKKLATFVRLEVHGNIVLMECYCLACKRINKETPNK
jgi:hypothetical protein